MITMDCLEFFDVEDFHKIIINSVKFLNFPTFVDERTLRDKLVGGVCFARYKGQKD